MRTSTILLGRLGALASIASATTHHLFVGNLVPPAAIYALKFDDETNDFAVLKNNTADASHAWITFDVRSSPPAFSHPRFSLLIFNPLLTRGDEGL